MNYLFIKLSEEILAKNGINIEGLNKKEVLTLACSLVQDSINENEGDKKNNGGGGLAGKMTPCAVLVIQNGTTKLVNVKNQDGLTKVLDMVPDFVNRFVPGAGGDESADEKED